MTFSFAIKARDMEGVFLFPFDICDTYYKRVIIMTLFLSAITPKIYLVVLVFFTSLVLVSKRLLVILSIGCISKRKISGLILPRVFLLLLCRPVPLKILGINLVNTQK